MNLIELAGEAAGASEAAKAFASRALDDFDLRIVLVPRTQRFGKGFGQLVTAS